MITTDIPGPGTTGSLKGPGLSPIVQYADGRHYVSGPWHYCGTGPGATLWKHGVLFVNAGAAASLTVETEWHYDAAGPTAGWYQLLSQVGPAVFLSNQPATVQYQATPTNDPLEGFSLLNDISLGGAGYGCAPFTSAARMIKPAPYPTTTTADVPAGVLHTAADYYPLGAASTVARLTITSCGLVNGHWGDRQPLRYFDYGGRRTNLHGVHVIASHPAPGTPHWEWHADADGVIVGGDWTGPLVEWSDLGDGPGVDLRITTTEGA